MKNTMLAFMTILLLTGVHLVGRQTAVPDAKSPCNDPAAAENASDKKKDAIEHDPLADPAEELRIRAQKKVDEKNFKELQDAANNLAAISAKMAKEVDASGQYAISLKVLDDLDEIEKLTKKARSRAK